MPQALTRRKKRLIYTLVGSMVFILLAAGLVWFTRPRQTPYRPGEKVEGVIDSLGRQSSSDAPRVQFTDVTAASGIHFRHFFGERSAQLPEDMGSGAAWGDYNNDGWQDLYVVNIAGALTLSADEVARSPASNRLYKNNGDGTFTDVTDAARVGGRGCGMGAAWGDYDNDGDLDLVVTDYGKNHIYRNNGDSTFTEVSGIESVEGFWTGASWSDYDRDGDLDLYICGYVQYQFNPADLARVSSQYEAMTPATLNPSSYPPAPNLLYRNNGDGTFTEIAREAGVDNPKGRSLSAVWCDFDNDTWPDLYVANDVSDNAMYRNNGDGTFADVSHEAWVADYRGAMGLAPGDWDNDGDFDLFVTHWIAQENALYNNLLSELRQMPDAATPKSLRFTDMADAFGLGQIALDYIGWGTTFLDYDNDGRLDLFVVNGSTFQDRDNPKNLVPMRDQLFWNAGTEGFFDVGNVSGSYFQEAWVGRGAAFADYDNDGDVDAFIVNHGAPAKLLRNDGGNAKRWLKVRLKGVKSNRFGIGALLTAILSESQQTREVISGASYLSQDAAEVIIGCDSATEVASLKLSWPSGVEQELTAIPTNQTLEVIEGIGLNTTLQTSERTQNSLSERAQVQKFWETYRQAVQVMKTEARWKEAADLFREALAINPSHEDSLYYLGNCLFELGEYSAALAQFKRLVEINPQSLRGFLQIGALHASPHTAALFNLDNAEKAFKQALAINPEESGSLLQLGAVLLAKGNLEEASRCFSMVRQLNFKAVEAYYLDGYIHWKRGDTATALTLFNSAIEHSKGAQPLHGVLGEGDTKRADRRALTSASAHQHRLFGEKVAALAKGKPEGTASTKEVDEAYQQLNRYISQFTAMSHER